MARDILGPLPDDVFEHDLPNVPDVDKKYSPEYLEARQRFVRNLESFQKAGWDESKHPRHPAGSDRGGEFTEAYHGTTDKALAAILRDGIQPGDNDSLVWMTSTKDEAMDYAYSRAEEHKKATPVIFRIKVPHSEVDSFDRRAWVRDQYLARGTAIPASWIVGYYTLDNFEQVQDEGAEERYAYHAVGKGLGKELYAVLFLPKVEKYSPDQPRHPKGSEEGGRWSKGGLYHGTTVDLLKAIKEQGLKPGGFGRRNYGDKYYIGDRAVSVYLTDSLKKAADYADNAAANVSIMMGMEPTDAGKDFGVILEVRIPDEEIGKLKLDEKIVSGYRFEGDIPPKWIVKVRSAMEAYGKGDGNTIFLVIMCDQGVEKYSSNQPRHPKGNPEGGQWRGVSSALRNQMWWSGFTSFSDLSDEAQRVILGKQKLYHGTASDAVESIRKYGLEPAGPKSVLGRVFRFLATFETLGTQRHREASVFFTTDRWVAKEYGKQAAAFRRGIQPVIFTVQIPEAKAKRNMRFDEATNGWRYEGSIPPEWIKRVEHNPVVKQGILELYGVVLCDEGVEKYSPDQPRHPKGSEEGGQWVARNLRIMDESDDEDARVKAEDALHEHEKEQHKLYNELRAAAGKAHVAPKDYTRDKADTMLRRPELDKAISYKLPKDVVVYRGIYGQWFRPNKMGKGYVSVSTSFNEAQRFAYGHDPENGAGSIVVITLPKGTKVAFGSKAEDEFVLAYGTKFNSTGRVKTLYSGQLGIKPVRLVKYDPDQPRHPKGSEEGGQWRATGGSVYTDEIRKRALRVAEYLNFPADKLEVVEDEEPTFMLNDKEYKAAGLASKADAMVRLFVKNISGISGVEGLMAHEVMHQRYHKFMDIIQAQEKEIMALPRENLGGGRENVMFMDGTLKAPFDAKYPEYQAFAKYGTKVDELRKTDGVTEYSREWWKNYEDGVDANGNRSYSKFQSAMHETLAEMASEEYNTTVLPGAPVWKGLYEAVSKVKL